MTSLITTHISDAIARLRSKIAGKPNIEALLNAWVAPVQSLENALIQLLLERAIDTAIGNQLDVLGRVVGQEREGRTDEDYRLFLRVRVRVNRSSGMPEELIAITDLVINDLTDTILVEYFQPAAVAIGSDVAVDLSLANVLIGLLVEAKAAGVCLFLNYSPGAISDAFTFGVCGFLDGAQGPAAGTLTLLDTTELAASGSLLLSEGLAVEETIAYTGKSPTTVTGVTGNANAHEDRSAACQSPGTGKGFDGPGGGQLAGVLKGPVTLPPAPPALPLALSELWEVPASPNEHDDEFNVSGLDPAWTRINYTTPSLDATDILAKFASGDPREDINLKASWFRVQSPSTGTRFGISKRLQAGELPDGTYWARITMPYRFGNIIQGDSELGLSLLGDSGGAPDVENNGITIWIHEKDLNTVGPQVTVWNPNSSVEMPDQEGFGMIWEYAAMIKDGSTIHCLAGSRGGNWVRVASGTPSVAVEHVALLYNNASQANPGNAIVACDFFRFIPRQPSGELVLP